VKNFFRPNLQSRGRWIRGLTGAGCVAGGVWFWSEHQVLAFALFLIGGFCLFQASRGWCLARACGVKTRW
jgi:hypothetical protein